MFILKKEHQPGVYVSLKALFQVSHVGPVHNRDWYGFQDGG